MQKTVNYSGIQGIGRQDQAMIECMGEIVDRTLEHLAPSDRMIAITRKRLLEAAQTLMKEGKVPATVDDPDIYRRASGRRLHRPVQPGLAQDAYADKLKTALSPARPAGAAPLAAE
jgi:hypothetical protein